MRLTTLCYLIRGDEVCLAKKKRSLGAGMWNGCGGKAEPGETIEQAAVRETKEEICVDVAIPDLHAAGIIKFHFADQPQWDQEVHVFYTHRWQGEPQETAEMAPQWFKIAAIPYSQMWPDDIYWMPKMFAGQKFTGECRFSGSDNKMDKCEIKDI